MRKLNNKKLFLLLFVFCKCAVLFAQPMVLTENKTFQDYFFEALLQRGIENYDKAIQSLEKCLQDNPNDASVYFELGKNYLDRKEYAKAYSNFERATQLDPNNKWYWNGMYEVCSKIKDFKLCVGILNKLISFDEQYTEDLISLYMSMGEFEKALKLINEINDKYGSSEIRDTYKLQILSGEKYQDVEIANLISQIQKNPKDEENYVALIYLYSKNDNKQKAEEVSRDLEKNIPDSEWAQVSLFKKYLDNNDGQKAVKSMNIILGSVKIDYKIKHRVLNEFLIFVQNNPQYEEELEKAITHLEGDDNISVSKEVAKYYHNKKQFDKAIKYYNQSSIRYKHSDLETEVFLLQCYSELNQYEILSDKAMEMVELYPAQPQFYYFCGLANNKLKKYKKAKSILEMGIDYVIEDVDLEILFYKQMQEACNGLGDERNKEIYIIKINQLINTKRK